MENFGNNFQPPKPEVKKTEKLTREEVISKLDKGENLENYNLAELDLSGLNFEGKSFRNSDLRGVTLYNDSLKEGTNLKKADFTDTIIADLGPEVIFANANAEGAKFGFTENLSARRKRLKNSGQAPEAADSGEFFNFNGSLGNFKKTKWLNADFGGGSGCEALFPEADLSEAEITGCDLNQIDFSKTKIDKIKIIDPITLQGMKIATNQIKTVVQSIQLTNQDAQAEFLKEINEKGSRKALEDFFEIEIKD
ncbi:MAG: pentapeptide repeat-containing protein [Candidatus Parcubacteria bacterium]|nr:pentapeptide repeat-containing protein [Candidatus Parcubacteria bacterium]